MDTTSPRVDPNSLLRLGQALGDPQAETVLIGKRPTWSRHLVKLTVAYGIVMALNATGVLDAVGDRLGISDEMTARSRPVAALAQKPERIRWLIMPTSPFLDVAKRPDGTYSIDHLVGAYKAAGISSDQALDIIERINALSPVLMGADDALLASQLQQGAQATSQQLALDYPDAKQRLEKMIKQQIVPRATWRNQATAEENWTEVRTAWERNGAVSTNTQEMDTLSGMAMSEATQTLEVVMKAVGLRALRITPATWARPQYVYDMAMGLNQANEDLADATGWKGQVLGLGGRVFLTISSPPVKMGAAGFTRAAVDGQVEVVAQWRNLSHEWIHALDYVAATKTFDKTATIVLSEQLKPLRFVQDDESFAAWKKSSEQLVQAAPVWVQARERESDLAQAAGADGSTATEGGTNAVNEVAYWRSQSERLAFAFQAYVGNSNPLVLRETSTNPSVRNDYYMPSSEESAAQAPVFRELFASIAHWNLSAPMPEQAVKPVSRLAALQKRG